MSENNYQAIQPVGNHFRTLPPHEAFSWKDGIMDSGASGLYVVTFYSIRNNLADPEKIEKLLRLDHEAFEEAQQMEGFGTYWHDDDLSEEGVGLSFCLWHSRDHAKKAARKPRHLAAVEYTRTDGRQVYSQYNVESHYVHRIGEKIVFEPA